MASRWHTTRHSAEDLRRSAMDQATPAQFDVLRRLTATGWSVKAIYGLRNAPPAVMVTLTAPNACVGALYPDGTFTRNLAGRKSIKLNAEWAKPGDWTF
jgi:hypothetical protein